MGAERAEGPMLPAGSVAIVTGATGFIGSALVDRLAQDGVRVRCLTRTRLTARDAGNRADIEWHVVNWSDPRALDQSRALDGARYVFHLAGATKARSIESFRAGNVLPTQALLAALVRRAAPIDRFVLVSSQAAAGPAAWRSGPRREADAPAPIDPYGATKLEAERVLEAYRQIPWTIVRPSSVYGPRDRDFLAVFKQVRSGLWLYPATRDHWLSLVYVDDVVRGMLVAATSSRAVGRTYFLTAEPPVTWPEVYRAAASASRARRVLELDLPQFAVNVAGRIGDAVSVVTRRVGLVNSRKVELGKPQYWICSGERAREELGFDAQVSLHEGMAQTYAWYRQAKWL